MAEQADGGTDASLVRAASEGDRRACEELYRRYAPWLIVRLRQRCDDESMLDDVVQDVFVALWDGSARAEDIRDVPGWLWRIGQRRLVDLYRKQQSHQRLHRLLHRQRPRTEQSAEDIALAHRVPHEIFDALDRLSPEHREAIQASALHGLTMRQISARLGIPLGTVKTRILRARRLLRQDLT